jgi:hypothetical protein
MKKFTRLAYNTNGYQKPSAKPWNASSAGKQGKKYEDIFGYGHEEWLFNPNFRHEGYQYGYIRGLTLKTINKFEEVHLYNFKEQNGKISVFHLGYINNVEGIWSNEDIQNNIVKNLFKPYFKQIIADVKSIGADPSHLQSEGFYNVTVRFKVTDMQILSEPVLLPDFDTSTYSRYKAYNIDDNFLSLIKEVSTHASGCKSGKAKQNKGHSRTTKSSTTTVEKLHTLITNSLEQYLKPKFSTKNNLSIEKTRFNKCTADVVTLLPKGKIDIYEIKTTSNPRINIRDAISQLLDYTVHSKEKVNCLYIVSPAVLDTDAKKMLKALNKIIKYQIFYLYYDVETKKIIPI